MIHKVHFGKRIASYRKQQAWSQAELAEKLGVTSQAVSKWETGAALPDIDLLLEECDKQKNAAAKAAVLDYAHQFDPADTSKTYKL